MKAKVVVGSLLATMLTFEVVAQRVENDDMYFNSKDREKLKAKGDVAATDKSANDKIDSDYNNFRKKHFDKDEAETEVATETANPTDSYSARSVNPEYISRSNSEQATEDESYYVEGYIPANTYDSYSASTNNNNWNNYNDPYSGNNNYYGSNGWGSPYNPYSSACNPWMNPYYSSGMTLSLGYMWGSPGWNYGMSYGWGNYNPYSYYPAYYSPYYGGNAYYGSGYGYGYPTYYYGGTDSSRPNYGKRPSRHSAMVSPTPRSSERVSSNTTTSSGSNGRTRQPVDEYYVKPFKRTPATSDGLSIPSTSGSSDRYSKPSSSGSRSRDSYDRSSYSSPSRSNSSFSSPSRSGSSGVSIPSRSSSPSGGGGSSPAPRKRN